MRALIERCRRHASALRQQWPRPVLPLLLLLGALWPHGAWLVRRLTDGSDEPWGLLALLTVLALVLQARRDLVLPTRAALAVSAALAFVAALLLFVLPPILAAAAAMLALACFVTSALPRRPAAPLVALLLLALPVIASLQFYLGYPLRLATAHAAAPLLRIVGVDAQAAGAALVWREQTILVDPPCAGIGMLWVGAWSAALASYLNEATPRRTFVNGSVAAVAVFAANVLRNVLLFFPETGWVERTDGLHAVIGLIAFAAALVPTIAFASMTAAPARRAIRAGRQARALGESAALDGNAGLFLDPTPVLARLRSFRVAPAPRVRSFFVGACLAAAVLPLFGERLVATGATGRTPAAAVGTRSVSIEWPTHFRGQPLTQLPPTDLDARFAARFPGAVARFTDGEQLLVVRHVQKPTRLLHPASDCFRGAGYTVGAVAVAVDGQGVRWRCFAATRGTERLRVCERITERLDSPGASGWTDVSAWFWDAQWSRGTRSWWALTVVTPFEAGEVR